MRRGVDYVSSGRDRISDLATYSDEAMDGEVLDVQYPWRLRTRSKPPIALPPAPK